MKAPRSEHSQRHLICTSQHRQVLERPVTRPACCRSNAAPAHSCLCENTDSSSDGQTGSQ